MERPRRVQTQSDTELMARKVEKEEENKISAQSIRPCLKGAILINRNHYKYYQDYLEEEFCSKQTALPSLLHVQTLQALGDHLVPGEQTEGQF